MSSPSPLCAKCSLRLLSCRTFIIGRYLNARKNLFRGRNLVRAHYQQGLFFCENAEPRKDVQNRVAREECAGEVPKVRDDIVLSVSPITCEFKAVTCFLDWLRVTDVPENSLM